MMRNILLFVIVAAVFCCGCGKKIITVTGEVQYEGEPAKNIAILFEPKSSEKIVSESGVAVTDSTGRFTLKSSSGKGGIEPGNYAVYMNWCNPNAVDDGGAGPAHGAESQAMVSPYKFPEERPEIVVPIENGKSHFVFKVTSKEILWE